MRSMNPQIERHQGEGWFFFPDPVPKAELEPVRAEPPGLRARESPGRVPERVPGVVRSVHGCRTSGEAALREHHQMLRARVRSRSGHATDPFSGTVTLFRASFVEDRYGEAWARAGLGDTLRPGAFS
jgi:hypothetical protein